MKALRRLVVLGVAGLAACGSRGGSGPPTCEHCPPPPPPPPAPPPSTVRPPWPGDRPASYQNPIPSENALAGERGWYGGEPGGARFAAFADRASARAGEVVRVKVSSDVARGARWALYRIGWYGGAGARRLASGGPVPVGPQPACPPEPGTALVRCAWPTAFEVAVTGEMLSGYYAIRLERDDGLLAYAPLVVVDARPADLLVEASTHTWQAYNAWGGESLYRSASRLVPGGFALQVSYDRPYDSFRGVGPGFENEFAFARFLERHGYDVSYTTDQDVSAGGRGHLLRAGAFVSPGHDEYWPGAQRDALEAARDAGMPLLFFGANVGYWKVRLEAFDGPSNPRVVTCYKSAQVQDPVTGPERTGKFRESPIDRPENALVGATYESWTFLTFPLVVADGSSWLYDGTGLATGDSLPLVVGNEYDVTVDDGHQPPGTTVVARSPVIDAEGKPGFAETVHYQAASGALVFASGTIRWAHGVDPGQGAYDPRIERMTANVFRRALGLPVPPDLGPATGRSPLYAEPHAPFPVQVGTLAAGLDRPASVAPLPDGSVAASLPHQHRIVRISPAGAVEPFAGDGQPSRNPAFDGIGGLHARFYAPTALLALPDGSVLVADTYNHCIRRIGADPARTVTTVAGRMGVPGDADGSGSTARFSFPAGLALDGAAGEVLVADSGNHRIRAFGPLGTVRTVAGGEPGHQDGPAAVARLLAPTGVAVAPDGRVFIADSGSFRVKAIGTDAARTVTTIAGSVQGAVDGSGAVALLGPQGGALWAGDTLLVSDGPGFRVRAISPGATASATVVSTYAGSGSYGADDGDGRSARFGLPAGLAAGPGGTIYVADPGAGAIRTIAPAARR